MLEDRRLLAVYTWDGAHDASGTSADTNWMTAENWVGDVRPGAGDDLVFPSGAAGLANINDFPANTNFGGILISGSNYHFSGNAIELAAGISSQGTNNTFVIYVMLTAPQGIGQSVSGTFTVNSVIDLNGNDLSISTANSSGTTLLTGSIRGSGNVSTGGSGTTALAARNDYGGVTTVNAGTLAVRHAEALGAADGLAGTGTELAANATLRLENNITVVDELLSITAGNVFFASEGVNVWTGDVSGSGTTSLFLRSSTGSTLQIDGNVTTSDYLEVYVFGGGKAVLNGPTNSSSRLYVQNANTNLELNGTLTTLYTNSIQSGATLSGNGTNFTGASYGTQILNTSRLNPGTLSGTGILHTEDVNFQSGSHFDVLLNGTDAGTQHDQLDVAGTVSLAGNLSFSFGPTPIVLGALYKIIDNDGTTDAVVGTFAGLSQNAVFSAGVQTFQISYTGGDGNDVVVEAITGSPVVEGAATDDDFNLRRNGNVIELRNHGTLIYDSPLGVIQPFGLTINGGDGDDTLTIDYATGGYFSLDVAFNGDTNMTSHGDKLIVTGGTFSNATSTFTFANSGTIMLDTGSGNLDDRPPD
ncbi:MAG: hypothetical protein R3C28_14420 [Pirellulaceae bacterium]